MICFEDWERIDYQAAWVQQKELVEKRIQNQIADTLIFCEHNPVVTLGRASQRNAEVFPTCPYPVVEIERGGQATYHGPGQIVLYPIFGLAKKSGLPGRQGVLDLIRSLEKLIIEYLKSQSLKAEAIEGKTGVWVGEGARKIASIGIAVRHWVSYHGLALNFATGQKPWQAINPCGFEASVMTDLERELNRKFTYYELVRDLKEQAKKVFS